MDFNKVIDKVKRNSVLLHFDDLEDDLPIGTSKIGGDPDLPKDFEWYYYEGESPFDKKVKKRPLSFLAQINCSEVNPFDLDDSLPNRGMLYFFYELESMKWGFDPLDKNSARVFYYDGDIKELVRTKLPEDLHQDYVLPQAKIIFSKKMNVPSFEELSLENDLWDSYDDFIEKNNYTLEEPSSKLLGYADIIQNEMLLECEMVTNGIYCGHPLEDDPSNLEKLEEQSKEWKLLFQFDSITISDYDLMFGDSGRIYFYIKENDLKDKNFNNIWMILQCY